MLLPGDCRASASYQQAVTDFLMPCASVAQGLYIPAGYWHQVTSLDSPTLGTVVRYKKSNGTGVPKQEGRPAR